MNASTSTSEPAGPTGLQKSMRFLLQIIAGVLLADLVTKSVAIAGNKPSLGNIAICIAAGVFLFRIFVDNLLYYEATDKPLAGLREYAVRLFLLGLDLASYVVCYDIVFRIARYAEKDSPRIFTRNAIIRIVQDVAVVELFHFVWAIITWAALYQWHKDDERQPFIRWATLSLATALLMASFGFFCVPAERRLIEEMFASASLISLAAYLWFMRNQYMRIAKAA